MRPDAIGRMGLSPMQNCTVDIRILAYGSLADCVDEYVRIEECSATQCLQKFVKSVNEIFGQEYLRRPNKNDINRYYKLEMHEGFQNVGYYLADDIYPDYVTFVKIIPMPQGSKRKLFTKYQEAARKDVERASEVLKS
eukprot:XP_006577666.1 uncharacterized protein LOC102668057 [Glycine max]